MSKEEKAQKKHDALRILKWLAKSDLFISREQMARYSGIDLNMVNKHFEFLETNGFVKYCQSTRYGAVYKQNKDVVRKVLEHVQEWKTLE